MRKVRISQCISSICQPSQYFLAILSAHRQCSSRKNGFMSDPPAVLAFLAAAGS